jgi:hypothetical protein
MARVPFDSPTTDYAAREWVGASEAIQALIDEGWRPIHPNYDGEPEECVSIYFGSGGSGPAGTTHAATVVDYQDDRMNQFSGWGIVKLDKWGGTGSRKILAYGDIDDIDGMRKRMESIERRQISARRGRR